MNEDLKWVGYYRVSTPRQGESGLGLEAQQHAVKGFLAGKGMLIAEFIETESGKKVNRPKLTEALALCRRQKATLVIAKIDRLSRSVRLISGLLESGVNFVAADHPNRDPFIYNLLSVFAQEEGRRISERTKLALAAAKRRGVDIGATGRALAKKYKAAATEKAESYRGLVEQLRLTGFVTVQALGDELNRLGIASPGGGRWHLPTTHKLLMRLKRGVDSDLEG